MDDKFAKWPHNVAAETEMSWGIVVVGKSRFLNHAIRITLEHDQYVLWGVWGDRSCICKALYWGQNSLAMVIHQK